MVSGGTGQHEAPVPSSVKHGENAGMLAFRKELRVPSGL